MGDVAVRQEVVLKLREKIRQLEALPRSPLGAVPTGIGRFDAWVGGGLPRATVVELQGAVASGKTTLALRAVASATHQEQLAAFVDGPSLLCAQAAAAAGVRLAQLLVVRPPAWRQRVWAAVQLVRSGAFAVVVLDLTDGDARLSAPEEQRLLEAASKSGVLCLLLTPPRLSAAASLRLTLSAQGLAGTVVAVARSRSAVHGELALSWEELLPQPPLLRLQTPAELAALEVRFGRPVLPEVPDLRRLDDEVLEHQGVDGICAQRPGRDVRLPPLTAGAHALGN